MSAQVENGTGQAAIGIREYDFSYDNWAALVKLGAEYKASDWSAGVTLTTPRLGLFGGADVGASLSYVDQGVVTGSPPTSQIASNYQSQLSSTYHSPLSIGAGFGKKWKGTRVDISAEWFAAVPKFTIIPAVAFQPQSPATADTVSMALTAQYRSLVNWGVGIQHQFSERYNACAAFRTDNTAIPTGVRSMGTVVNWNLLHANLGVQATIGRAAIILGLDMAWGSKDDVSAATDPPPGLPAVPTIDESYLSITGAIGFKFTY